MELEKKNYKRIAIATIIIFATLAVGWAGFYLLHLKTAYPLVLHINKVEFPLTLGDSEWYRFPSNQPILYDNLKSVVLAKILMPVPIKKSLENSAWFRFPGEKPLAVEARNGIATDFEHWLGYTFQPPQNGSSFTTFLELVSTGRKTKVNIDFQKSDSVGILDKVYPMTLEANAVETVYILSCMLEKPVVEGEKWRLVICPEKGQPTAILSSSELIVSMSTDGWLATDNYSWLSSRFFKIPSPTAKLLINLGFFADGEEDIYIDLHKIDITINESVSSQRETIHCTSGQWDYIVEYNDLSEVGSNYEYKLLIWPCSTTVHAWLTKCIITTFSNGDPKI